MQESALRMRKAKQVPNIRCDGRLPHVSLDTWGGIDLILGSFMPFRRLCLMLTGTFTAEHARNQYM